MSARATAWRVGLAFGAAQGIAPLLGYAAGAVFSGAIAAYDHWVAFAILFALGAKLLKEGLTAGPEDVVPRKPAAGFVLLGLAVATSLDAAAAGVTFPSMGLSPLPAAAVIAIVTFAACFAGALLGQRLGAQLGGRAEVLGGGALIGLGVKILWDHGALAAIG